MCEQALALQCNGTLFYSNRIGLRDVTMWTRRITDTSHSFPLPSVSVGELREDVADALA